MDSTKSAGCRWISTTTECERGGKGKKKKKGKERERKIFHIQKGKGACLASSFSINLRYYDAMVGNN